MSDSRFDSEAFNRKLRKVMTLVVGSLLALVVVFAICTGHIKIGRVYHRDISAAENPGPFWSPVIFFPLLLCFASGTYDGVAIRSNQARYSQLLAVLMSSFQMTSTLESAAKLALTSGG